MLRTHISPYLNPQSSSWLLLGLHMPYISVHGLDPKRGYLRRGLRQSSQRKDSQKVKALD